MEVATNPVLLRHFESVELVQTTTFIKINWQFGQDHVVAFSIATSVSELIHRHSLPYSCGLCGPDAR
jgi:hypothetical protein